MSKYEKLCWRWLKARRRFHSSSFRWDKESGAQLLDMAASGTSQTRLKNLDTKSGYQCRKSQKEE